MIIVHDLSPDVVPDNSHEIVQHSHIFELSPPRRSLFQASAFLCRSLDPHRSDDPLNLQACVEQNRINEFHCCIYKPKNLDRRERPLFTAHTPRNCCTGVCSSVYSLLHVPLSSLSRALCRHAVKFDSRPTGRSGPKGQHVKHSTAVYTHNMICYAHDGYTLAAASMLACLSISLSI